MVKLFRMATAGVFAALAAASLIALATAAPATEEAQPDNCHKAFCIVAFF
ncbi:hypothetical protein PUV54_05355 [Hyphococcus flavus]|uniref:Uncharacterized protein n=1 Tax=Hyphococcus flavus TaxID=1866326 RepID=A0AAF0CFM5_9PROT|nr:hypothetical protein [Hyphococcus flavus]WDI32621.1 hypothetical protein PUV54_05355 [Hyphococcus flavus]